MQIPRSRKVFAAVTLLLAMMALLAGGAARRESVTVDEVAHIGAGVSYLQKLDLRMNVEHPPLAKVLAVLPLVLRGVHADYSNPSWAFSNRSFNEYLGECRVSGQRRYDVTALHRLVLIQRARQTGFALTEIKATILWISCWNTAFSPLAEVEEAKDCRTGCDVGVYPDNAGPFRTAGEVPLHGSGGVRQKDIREAVRKGVVLTSGKLHVLVGTHDPQHGPDRNGESLPCRIVHDFRRGKLIFLPASL